MGMLFYSLVLLFGILTSDAKLYSEDELYITNFTTTYRNIPNDCSLFGRKFETDYSDNNLILNIKETGTYWVGAKIGFKRNINPLGVLNVCKGTHRESLDDCNIHCKGLKYFSYKEHTCSCSNHNHTDNWLVQTYLCKKPENGLCYGEGCVVYERGVLNKDYLCSVYYYHEDAGWLYSTQNCSVKLRFICEGEKLQSDSTQSSWLEAEHICAKKALHLSQNKTKIQGDSRFKDGTRYWVSVFRQKKISWGQDSTKTVCAAARLQTHGSYLLETHFCNESLEALCHRPEHINYDTKKRYITLSLSVIVAGVLFMVTLILVIAIISIISFKRIRIYKEQLRKVNERLPGTEFSTYTGIEVNNEEVNGSGYNELAVNTPQLLADCHENEMDPADEEMDNQGYLVPEQHYHTIPEVEVHYAEACVVENNVV